MEVKLIDGRTITLNSQQVSGLQTLDQWYKSGDLFVRVLGYAGTGKTTISKFFLDKITGPATVEESGELQMAPRLFKEQIAVSAPTHKAKRVISTITGYQGKTIQALLGLGLDVDIENFDPNKPEFAPKRDPEISGYKIILLDEASMLGNKGSLPEVGKPGLLDFLLNTAEDSNTRIIFLMDEAQLPPVNEKLCPVAVTDRIFWEVKLTHVERQQEDNPLMQVYDRLRSNLGSYLNMYPEVSMRNEKGEGITINTDNNMFAREMYAAFKGIQDTHEAAGSVKVLCWRNVSVQAWNTFLRRALFGANAKPINEGELLMSYSNVKGKIENSAEYLIERIEETTANYDCSHDTFGKTLAIKTGELHIWRVQVFDIHQKFRSVLDIIKPEDGAHVGREALKFMAAAKQNRSLWVRYFDWRARFYLLQDVFLREKKALKKDLDYGYAITVHKAQGSTYDHVFVDERDLSRNPDITERNKLRYVALSRPRLSANVLV